MGSGHLSGTWVGHVRLGACDAIIGTLLFRPQSALRGHDLIPKPVTTLGSSPRACFWGSCRRWRNIVGHKEILRQGLRRVDAIALEIGDAVSGKEIIVDQKIAGEF